MKAIALPILLYLLSSVAVWADACLDAGALAQGVAVTVKDGSVQVFRRKGADVEAQVTVLENGSGFVARQKLTDGLFVTSDQRSFREAPPTDGTVIVGGNDGGTRDDRYRWADPLEVPAPGSRRVLSVTITRKEDGPSIGPQPKLTGRAEATVVTLAEKTVALSGCDYRIWPVETEITAPAAAFGEAHEGGPVLFRRQIWFPDLGFAVTTKEVGSTSGWSEDWGQGIIALSPAS